MEMGRRTCSGTTARLAFFFAAGGSSPWPWPWGSVASLAQPSLPSSA